MRGRRGWGRMAPLLAGTAWVTVLVLLLSSWPSGSGAGRKEVDPEVTATAAGSNAFAFDLYARLKETPGNLIFSPYSLSSALAMTFAGARGETEKEMAEVLHFTLGQEKLHTAMGSLTRDLNERGSKGQLELAVANRLFGQKGKKFLAVFLEVTRRHYGAELEEVDFFGAPEEARQLINAWAEKETRGKIREPLPRNIDLQDTLLALANAIYFKGKWESQFDKTKTEEAPFHLNAKEEVKVPMMFQKGKFKWGAAEGVQFLELPYVGEELSMLILLPREVEGLSALEEQLKGDFLDSLLREGTTAEVEVYLPRFKLEFGKDMAEELEKMGMKSALGPGADFSGMSAEGALFISRVIHKAMVEVNEEGTEAAAVTIVTMSKSAAVRPAVFRADHPFLFILRDRPTGTILFLGRVVDPRG